MKLKYIALIIGILFHISYADDLKKIKDFGEYHALLIWVEDYQYVKTLDTPKKDIEDIAEILEGRYFFSKQNIHTIKNPKNYDVIVYELDKLKKNLNEEDNLLIYYAGHGSAEDNKTAYWTLADGQDVSITRVGSISLNEVVTQTFKKMKSKHILVVSDSCYSGILTRESSSGTFGAVSRNELNYYKELYSIQSRTAMTSGGIEPVQDGDSLNPDHSVFANAFLRVLKRNKNPLFSLNEKYKDIREYVWLGAKQKPTYEGLRFSNHKVGGDFIFIDKKSISSNPDILNETSDKNQIRDNIEGKPLKKIANIDNILIYSLGTVSLLLLIVSIMHFRTRKKIPIPNDEENKLEKNGIKINETNISIDSSKEARPPLVKKKIPKKLEGTINMGKLIYQNQPFTKQYIWQEAKEYAEKLRLGEFDDWRLPTLKELRALGNIDLYGEEDVFWNEWYQKNKDYALVNSKGEKHFVHEKLIENMPKESAFWTSEAKDEYDIWIVKFNLGSNNGAYSEDKHYVICVRDNNEGEN